MTKEPIAQSDLATRVVSTPCRMGRRGSALCSKALKAAGVAALFAAALWTLPGTAKADCDVPDSGIPDDVAMKLDVGGARAALAKAGIGVSATYYGEAFYNWGGMKDGGAYDGVLELDVMADMKKLGLWKGLCFFANGYQIHGRSVTADYVGSLMPVSNLEATPATRLFELWFEQHMFNDKVAVKVGQLAADAEFLISEGGGYFLNGTWGWPSITAADMPSGGPAYPLATPGVRVAINPNDNLGLMIGLYNGDPAPACASDDPQRCNRHGTNFEMNDDPLLMIEGAYKYNQDRQLPGTIKIGGWNHFGDFEDQRFDSGGLPIAVTGNPGRPIDNDWGLYVVIDQLLWRVPGSEDPKGVGVFTRFIGAPDKQNLVDFYFDGGFTFTGMIPGRPADSLAIGYAYTGISNRVQGFDVDSGLLVARNREQLIEICYTYEIKPGWSVQPDFQYIFSPGGNVPEVKDAKVIGARTTLTF